MCFAVPDKLIVVIIGHCIKIKLTTIYILFKV